VIGGGNAPVINQLLTKESSTLQLTPQTIIAENLVLQGLYLLDKFMQSDTQ
jgi:predicted nuclease of restriction endonuclease-like (RecB) superfamily